MMPCGRLLWAPKTTRSNPQRVSRSTYSHKLRAKTRVFARGFLGGLSSDTTPVISEGVLYFRTRSHLVSVAEGVSSTPFAAGSSAENGEKGKDKGEELGKGDVEPSAAESKPKYSGKLPTAEDLFAGHVKARGGETALRKHRSMALSGKLDMPSVQLSIDTVIKRLAPDRYLSTSKIPGLGSMQQGYDGEVGWMMSPQTGPRLFSGEVLEALKVEADLLADLKYLERFASVKTVDRTNFHGQECWVVSAKDAEERETKFYFDVVSGLLAGSDGMNETPMGAMRVIAVHNEYKDFDGLKISTLRKSIFPLHDVEQVIRIEDVSFDPIDPKTFELPEEIKTLRNKKREESR